MNNRNRKNPGRNGKAKDNLIVKMDPRELIPSPENAILYRERTTCDSDFARLVESIRKEGACVLPRLASQDLYVIFGPSCCGKRYY